VVVTFACFGEEVGESLLREVSMAGDWLQVCAPLGLRVRGVSWVSFYVFGRGNVYLCISPAAR
jgi:hypothetical protein